MDCFNLSNLHAEKISAMKRRSQLRNIANVFRFVEICVVLVLIFRLSIQLPIAVKYSAEYLQNYSGLMVSPRFVFVIGNVTIIVLFAKSGHFSARDSPGKGSGSDLYEEFIQSCVKTHRINGTEIKYPEKQRGKTENGNNCLEIKEYRRINTEKLSTDSGEKHWPALRRSETDICKKNSYPEDEMSNEEFQQTVEAFIARQQRIRMEEEYSAI